MEKDIKIIQEKMDIIESLCVDDCINKSVVIEPLKQAIENLIARNKELESALDNSVRKDEIKEKIEEYTELVKDFEKYWSKDPRKFKKEKSVDYYKIEALQELLNKGE